MIVDVYSVAVGDEVQVGEQEYTVAEIIHTDDSVIVAVRLLGEDGNNPPI